MVTASGAASPTPPSWLITAARMVDLVRANPGITRTTAAQELGLSSGSATDLLARLRDAHILDETPAPAQGRGRPTTILQPHPTGPLVVVAELEATGWRVARAGIDGEPMVVARATRLRRDPQRVLDDMAEAIAGIHVQDTRRVRAVSLSVAGTISDDRLVQFTPRGWADVDLSRLTAQLPTDVELPVLVGNDATLAGLAEARTGSARGVGTVLHLIVAVGIGGALIVDGVPAVGAHGGAGEYGHVPFGDRSRVCPCGARGCWGLSIDGLALAELRGDPPPSNPIIYAHEMIDDARQSRLDAAARHAVDTVGSSLGSGIAGLVNLHDPDMVTLGGLATPLRQIARAAFDDAYQNGLMAFRKQDPPPVVDGVHGEDGPLRGAAIRGIDHVTTPEMLMQWAGG